MPNISWPTSKVLDIAIRKIACNTDEFLGARFAPLAPRMAQVVEYDEIHGPMGMVQAHNLDSDPPTTKMPNVIKKSFTPGYFKEKIVVNESDLLKLRSLGATEYQTATRQEIIQEGLFTLNTRIENRLEWLRWQAILNGQVDIDENNIKFSATYGVPAANLNGTVAASWATKSSSKPVEDFLTLQQNFIGSGYRMKNIILNSYTASLFCLATDTKTFAGAGIQEKVLPGNISKYGPVFLPGTEWVIYDGGYKTDAGVFTKFIPDNKIVLLGDAPIGEIIDIVTVPSLNGSGGTPSPGKFAFINEEIVNKANPRVELIGGIYCLPRIRRPEALQIVDVTEVTA